MSAIGMATPITGASSHFMVTKHTVGGAGIENPGSVTNRTAGSTMPVAMPGSMNPMKGTIKTGLTPPVTTTGRAALTLPGTTDLLGTGEVVRPLSFMPTLPESKPDFVARTMTVTTHATANT